MSDQEEKNNQLKISFMTDLQDLFLDMDKKQYNFNRMLDVAQKIDSSFEFSSEEFKVVADRMANLTKEVDIRLRENFFQLFKKVYMQCEDFNEAIKYFLNLDVFVSSTKHTPDLKITYQPYDEEFSSIQRKIGSFNDMTEKVLDELAKELGFLLMINPYHTTIQFIFACIESGTMIPAVTRIFERLSAIRDYRLPRYHSSVETDPFYINVFLKVYNEHYDKLKLDTPEGRQNFESICLSFTRTRFKNYGKGKDLTTVKQNEPNMDATDFLVSWVFENFSRNRDYHILISLLCKLMEFDSNRKYFIRWVQSDDETQSTEKTYADPTCLVNYAIEVFIHFPEFNPDWYSEIISCMPKVFTNISKKLHNDGVKIKSEDIMGKLINLDWAYKYAVGHWMYAVLDDYKPELPSALYYVLDEGQKQKYARLAHETDVMLTQDFFLALFELAMVIPSAALEFLDYGTYATPNIDDVHIVICRSLVRATAKQTTIKKITDLKPLIDKLIALYAVPLLTYGLDSMLTTDAETFFGLRNLLPILLYGEAVRLELLLLPNDGFIEGNVKDLMLVFSSMLNPIIDGFTKTMRDGNQRAKGPSLTPGPMISIANQLCVIRYLIKCIEEELFDRKALDTNNQFKHLSTKVNKCIELWFETDLAPCLDDFILLEQQTASINVYANPTPEAQKAEKSFKLQSQENILSDLLESQKQVAPKRNRVVKGWEDVEEGKNGWKSNKRTDSDSHSY